MNKLYTASYTDSEGYYRDVHIVLPDVPETERAAITQQVYHWIAQEVEQCGIEKAADEVRDLMVYECRAVQDLDGDWHAIRLEPLEI